MIYRKTDEEKAQKQLEMIRLESKYEEFLAKKISQKRNIFLAKDPEIKTIFQEWLYGVYVAILDNQQAKDGNGKSKLYFLFENIPESKGKYKLTYEIIDNNCIFKTAELQNFPKSYLNALKKGGFDLKKEESAVSELIAEKYKAGQKKKTKDVIKMEYRACDLYYNHKISPEKIAATLRNRLKKAEIQRIVKLYPYFKKYSVQEPEL